MTAPTIVGITVNAGRAATAWLNAFLATSQDEARPALYRTLSVELFEAGAQFVGCDGTMLFRAWVPGDGQPMPDAAEAPERAVVVMDTDKFALAFMRTLLAAAGDDAGKLATLSLAVEPAEGDTPLGEAFQPEILTLRAFGQELHCRLYESSFPDWRGLRFGLDRAEAVDGMTLAVRLFAAVGKLKGMLGVDCAFIGAERQIVIHAKGAEAEVRGLLMPMRRPGKQTPESED
jgi:hypothetical protein